STPTPTATPVRTPTPTPTPTSTPVSTPTPTPTSTPTATPTPTPTATPTPPPTGQPFPLGVWLQDPTRTRNGQTNAVNYKNIGITTSVGLWSFPTDSGQYAGWSVQAMTQLQNNGEKALAGTDPNWIKSHPQFANTLQGYMLGDEADMNKVNGDAEYQPDNWQ